MRAHTQVNDLKPDDVSVLQFNDPDTGDVCYSVRVGTEGAPELTLFGDRADLLGAALRIVKGLGYGVGPPVDKLGETELDVEPDNLFELARVAHRKSLGLPALGGEWDQGPA